MGDAILRQHRSQPVRQAQRTHWRDGTRGNTSATRRTARSVMRRPPQPNSNSFAIRSDGPNFRHKHTVQRRLLMNADKMTMANSLESRALCVRMSESVPCKVSQRSR